MYTSYTYIDGGVFKRKRIYSTGELAKSCPLKPLQCELQLRDDVNCSMGMLLHRLNTKTEPESDPPILVLHKFPLFQLFYKSYDILEVPQVVFICLEMSEIPW